MNISSYQYYSSMEYFLLYLKSDYIIIVFSSIFP